MATQRIELQHSWHQLTTGKETLLLQVCGDRVAVCDSPSQPEDGAAAHTFGPGFYTLTPPSVIWARSAETWAPVFVVVS
ncbi:hypothetical protein EN46_07445 [Citrobacter amalonaticus]